MDAIMSGSALLPRLALRMPVSRMATKADIAETIFSLWPTGAEAWNKEAMICLYGIRYVWFDLRKGRIR
ncbi:hypothetical protein SCL_1289 [Sulfuricaulis limicola]|uniref:Uncharacterized protein n=1 Tax=Sulfuricaulis limicola TaxID=1620215 RepID=A0A1B4XFL8_9GAMM|nr:hypothetical protein SCL_1289 [Sulfuricaulis limicola]